MIQYFAMIAAWAGEKDLALQQLEKAAIARQRSSATANLKLIPIWDPLRGDPRFEKIVASLAPRNDVAALAAASASTTSTALLRRNDDL